MAEGGVESIQAVIILKWSAGSAGNVNWNIEIHDFDSSGNTCCTQREASENELDFT